MQVRRIVITGCGAPGRVVVLGGGANDGRAGDETAAEAGGHGRLRASHADREQVIAMLKVAFVHGMLDRDEFGQRLGQAFTSRTHAELDTVTADLPAGLAAAQPPAPARAPGGARVLRPGRVIAAATTLYAGVWPFTFALPWPVNSEGDPPAAIIRPVLLDHPHLPVRFGHSGGVCDRRVAGEAFRRPATATARAWRGWSGSPAPATGRPAQTASSGRSGHQNVAEAARSRRPRRRPCVRWGRLRARANLR